MVRVQLNDGVVLRLDGDLAEVQHAYETALATNQMLEIMSADGTTRAVNPHQILYLEANGGPDPESSLPPARDATAAGSR
jgi:hypothetical protein